jgi:membrane protein implicated in regulation of membrane protease activity
MAQSTLWWLLAGAAIGVELATGTFYLLMLAIGLAAAAISAHLGGSFAVQIVIAALVSAGTVLGWRQYKKNQPSSLPANANRDVNMDIGETVQVDAWKPDGTSSVKYRGAIWAVASVSGGPMAAGLHQVVEVVGSRLIVRKL